MMSRDIRFRAWDRKRNEWYNASNPAELTFYGFAIFGECTVLCTPPSEDWKDLEITQFTGLLDKQGKEIYELHELNNKYTVGFKDGRYVLYYISSNDIFQPLNETVINAYNLEITGEYAPMEKD